MASGPADLGDGPLGVLLEDPGASAVLTDFDGTLAPIVPDPATSRPLPGAPQVLRRLSDHYSVVAVVSGRPVAFLDRHLAAAGPAVGLYGGYGIEWIEWVEGGEGGEGGEVREVRVDPAVEPWRAAVAEVLAAARAEVPAGVGVEEKGWSMTLHWRRAPSQAGWARAFAASWSARTGLALQHGRQAVELRPPVALDKGTVVERLAGQCRAACFVGDDAGDLAAFEALDRLAAGGVRAVRMAVADEESPPELLAAADIVVEGPVAALEVLAALAAIAG